MKEGSIVLTNVLQADGKFKIRPALLLRYMPPFNDCLVCGISTQLHHQVKSFDEIAYPHKTEFMNSGLKQVSLIRLGFLAVIPTLAIIGIIGNISEQLRQDLLGRLAEYLILQKKQVL